MMSPSAVCDSPSNVRRARKRAYVHVDRIIGGRREVVGEVARGYPDVELTHFYADNAAYQLARDPCAFDVILADNLFGDILSDQAGAIAGSLGMMLDHSFGRRRPRGASRPPSPQRWTQGTARRILAVRRRPRA